MPEAYTGSGLTPASAFALVAIGAPLALWLLCKVFGRIR